MELREIQSEANGRILTAFAEDPKNSDIHIAMADVIRWSEKNPGGQAWLKVNNLELEPVDAMPSLEEREQVIAQELGTASFSSLPNHIVILDDMAHMRPEIIVNWTASMLYALGGGPAGYIIGGNILLVPRRG
jgi:hypothetical protein